MYSLDIIHSFMNSAQSMHLLFCDKNCFRQWWIIGKQNLCYNEPYILLEGAKYKPKNVILYLILYNEKCYKNKITVNNYKKYNSWYLFWADYRKWVDRKMKWGILTCEYPWENYSRQIGQQAWDSRTVISLKDLKLEKKNKSICVCVCVCVSACTCVGGSVWVEERRG